jgi:hypothetical protein
MAVGSVSADKYLPAELFGYNIQLADVMGVFSLTILLKNKFISRL